MTYGLQFIYTLFNCCFQDIHSMHVKEKKTKLLKTRDLSLMVKNGAVELIGLRFDSHMDRLKNLPHEPWSFTGVTAPFFRQSMVDGTAVTFAYLKDVGFPTDITVVDLLL